MSGLTIPRLQKTVQYTNDHPCSANLKDVCSLCLISRFVSLLGLLLPLPPPFTPFTLACCAFLLALAFLAELASQ